MYTQKTNVEIFFIFCRDHEFDCRRQPVKRKIKVWQYFGTNGAIQGSSARTTMASKRRVQNSSHQKTWH